jgi:hypothetical protein
MNIRTLTLVLGSALVVAAGGVSATACSSSSGGGGTPTKDSGTTPDSTSGNNDSGGGNEDTGVPPSDAGTGADCKNVSLHQNPPGAVYCGYDDAGNTFSCTADAGGAQCCLGGEIAPKTFDPQVCVPFATTCTNQSANLDAASTTPAVPIECNQVSDCVAAGQAHASACCLQGGTGPNQVSGCGYSKATQGTAIVCEGDAGTAGGATNCAAGEIQICSSQADCPSGTTCTAGTWKIYQIGFCLNDAGAAP